MATRPEDMFKDDRPARTKALKEFRYRKEGNLIKDGRDFKTWYHIDDAQRLVWKQFNDLKDTPVLGTRQLIKELMLPPYVSFDDIRLDAVNFFTVLINYFSQEENQNKRYLPFMVKPEIGGVHYVAGFLRRTAEGQVDLIIFNPVGLTKYDRIGTELAKLDKDSLNIANIISSPHPLQSSEKDDGYLVSCGPICVEFLRLAMSHLDWLAMLDQHFHLPEAFLLPLQNNYQETVLQYRIEHDKILEQVSDQDLDQLDEDYKFIIDAMLNGLSARLKQDNAQPTKESSEEDSSSLYKKYGLYEDEFFDDTSESDEVDFITDEENDILSDEEVIEDNKKTESINENIDAIKITPLSLSPKASPRLGHNHYGSASEILMASPALDKRENSQKHTLDPTVVLEDNSMEGTEALLGVKSVKEEINRLRTPSKSFFSIRIRCEKKAKLIEAALNEAIQKNQDVRNDLGVREALGYHRFFSFFGLKKAAALQHVEESLDLVKNQ